MHLRLFSVGVLLIVVLSSAACRRESESVDTVAVCPTFLAFAMKLDSDKYAVLPTASTSESMQLLANGTVQFVLAGRAQMPQEPEFPHVPLGEGYSFLASQEMSIREADLRTRSFVTNLDPEPLREVFGIRDLRHADDIYDSLTDNIAITDFDTTDYARAAPVHVLRDDGSRAALSRTPVLYCAEECPPEMQSFLRELLSLSPINHG